MQRPACALALTVSGTIVVYCSSSSSSVAAGAFDGACRITAEARLRVTARMHRFAACLVSRGQEDLMDAARDQYCWWLQIPGRNVSRLALYVETASVRTEHLRAASGVLLCRLNDRSLSCELVGLQWRSDCVLLCVPATAPADIIVGNAAAEIRLATRMQACDEGVEAHQHSSKSEDGQMQTKDRCKLTAP